MRYIHSARLARVIPVLRRLGLALALVGIFAVSFGGTFTCKGETNSSDFTRP